MFQIVLRVYHFDGLLARTNIFIFLSLNAPILYKGYLCVETDVNVKFNNTNTKSDSSKMFKKYRLHT